MSYKINKEPEYEKTPMQKNQNDWIAYFNEQKLKMVSAPDIYRAIKEKDTQVIESLKKDFIDDWEVTSTRIEYSKDSLKAKIIHDADSLIVKPLAYEVEIPYYDGEAKEDEPTEKYLQALFDTKDKIKEILSVLKSIDTSRKIYLWTPNQSNRKDVPLRAVGLCFDGDRFVVNGGWVGNNGGVSRGVSVVSAKQKAKK